jgi:alpha-mannosidase
VVAKPPAAGAGAAPPARPTRGDATAQDGFVLDNGVVRAEIDARGLLVSLKDHATGREAVPPGSPGNLLELHTDLPNRWDAWDIDEHYRHQVVQLTDVTAMRADRPAGDGANGADRGDALGSGDDAGGGAHGGGRGEPGVVVERRFGQSSVTQRISLAPSSPSLRITTTVDWHEREKLLKLGFPLDVRADRSAAETQFGHVFRATHENTSWEAAKFEFCAHRWLHVGEPGYGVAIANDGTYGHDVTRAVREDRGTTTTVRVSLLRAPRYPDPDTDQGEHTMVVTLRPGASIADAVHDGYAVNLPARTVRGAEPVEPLVRVTGPGVVVEAVKLAHDRSGDVIVRLYESLGARTDAVAEPAFDVSAVQVTDLLERETAAPPGAVLSTDAVRLTLRPFQIVTLRLSRL